MSLSKVFILLLLVASGSFSPSNQTLLRFPQLEQAFLRKFIFGPKSCDKRQPTDQRKNRPHRFWFLLQARAAVLTAAQCATYNEAKTAWMNVTNGGDTLSTHVGASMISGLVTTTLTAPVDVIKTNMFVGKLYSLSYQIQSCIGSDSPQRNACKFFAECPR